MIVFISRERRTGCPARDAVLRTLAALVPAAVDAVVRDVVVVEIAGDDALDAVADESGCGLIRAATFGDALTEALAGARASWVCVVKAGALPAREFGEDVAKAMGGAAAPTRSFLLRPQRRGLATVLPWMSPVAGVITPLKQLTAVPSASFADVRRRARPWRELPTRIIMSD